MYATQNVTDAMDHFHVIANTVYTTLTSKLTHAQVAGPAYATTTGQVTSVTSSRASVTTNVTDASAHVPAIAIPASRTPTSTTTDTAYAMKTGMVKVALITSETVTASAISAKRMCATDQVIRTVPSVPRTHTETTKDSVNATTTGQAHAVPSIQASATHTAMDVTAHQSMTVKCVLRTQQV